MLQHVFNNPERARQLVSFHNLQYGKNNRPTDVDALFELRDKLYVIVETKFEGNQMPFGQKLALERLVDDLSQVKPALLILATHTTPADEMIDLGSTKVVSFRYERAWHEINQGYLSVRSLVDKFILSVMGNTFFVSKSV